MWKLILKLFIYFSICFGTITYMLVYHGGSIDYFYEKFTTPKAKSMIIGDSRSLQGIQPQIINQYLADKSYDLPILNYSFTGTQAVSGPLYNNSILKKIDSTGKKGIFIISVTPDYILSKKGFNNESGEFREDDQPPHNMKLVDLNPNYEYLFRNLSFFHFKAIFKKNNIVHKDGWMEESNLPKDTTVFNDWKKQQIDLFLHERDKYYISNLRVNSLDKLITKLKNFGFVHLVRMPISEEFLDLENSIYPKFNSIIDSIAHKNNVHYFNFNRTKKIQYRTYDGHHIDKFGGKKFTKTLCDSILNYMK